MENTTKDWLREVRQYTNDVNISAFKDLVASALYEIKSYKRVIAEQEPVLEKILADLQFALEGRAVVIEAKQPPRGRKTSTDTVRQAALELATQGQLRLTAKDVVTKLVEQGFPEFAKKGISGSVGTVLAHMPEFRRDDETREYEYVQNDLFRQIRGNELAVGSPNGSGQS